MEKYVPYEKLSKKKQREFNAQKRGSWGSINPVTRKPRNSKAYDRNKASQWKRELHDLPCLCFMQELRCAYILRSLCIHFHKVPFSGQHP